MHFTATLALVLALSVSLVSAVPTPGDHSVASSDSSDSSYSPVLERRGWGIYRLKKQWKRVNKKLNGIAENIVTHAETTALKACFGRPKKNQEGFEVALSACMKATWRARDLAENYLYAGMTSKEIMSAAKARKNAICASLPDREYGEMDACRWAKSEAKHWVIFLDEKNRIYSLVVKRKIRQSVKHDLDELGTFNKVTYQEWKTRFKHFYRKSNALLKKSKKFDDEELELELADVDAAAAAEDIAYSALDIPSTLKRRHKVQSTDFPQTRDGFMQYIRPALNQLR
jgi:hypothetical protein